LILTKAGEGIAASFLARGCGLNDSGESLYVPL
jgi:hypothetical protein